MSTSACATSRTVHLEVVNDASTAPFLLAFRRFAARRLLLIVMISDKATIYSSAVVELTELMTSEKIATSLGWEGTVWKFIPKKAPWFGSYWKG